MQKIFEALMLSQLFFWQSIYKNRYLKIKAFSAFYPTIFAKIFKNRYLELLSFLSFQSSCWTWIWKGPFWTWFGEVNQHSLNFYCVCRRYLEPYSCFNFPFNRLFTKTHFEILKSLRCLEFLSFLSLLSSSRA